MKYYGVIYRIVCSATQKAYIGATTRTPKARFMEHIYDARNKPRPFPLRDAIRAYGADAFSVEPVCYVISKEDLIKAEAEIIIKYNTIFPAGYNLSVGPGVTHPISRKKLSNAGAGRKMPPRSEQWAKLQRASRVGRCATWNLRKVIITNLNTGTERTFNSVNSAAKALNTRPQSITDTIHGRHKTIKGKYGARLAE